MGTKNRKRLGEVENQLEESQQQVDVLQQENRNLRAILQETEAQIDVRQKELMLRTRQTAERDGQISLLEEQLLNEQSKFARHTILIQEELETLKADFQHEKEMLKMDIDSKSVQLKHMQRITSENIKLKTEKADLINLCDNLREAIRLDGENNAKEVTTHVLLVLKEHAKALDEYRSTEYQRAVNELDDVSIDAIKQRRVLEGQLSRQEASIAYVNTKFDKVVRQCEKERSLRELLQQELKEMKSVLAKELQKSSSRNIEREEFRRENNSLKRENNRLNDELEQEKVAYMSEKGKMETKIRKLELLNTKMQAKVNGLRAKVPRRMSRSSSVGSMAPRSTSRSMLREKDFDFNDYLTAIKTDQNEEEEKVDYSQLWKSNGQGISLDDL
ncbi:hypothetical protein PCE1_004026 [Barthelona sp. PCE]